LYNAIKIAYYQGKMKTKLKPLDFAAIGLSLGLTIFCGLTVYAAPQAQARVIVRGSGRTWIFPLDAEERVTVPGPLGETVVEIREAGARVLSSPCENQTCVAAGHIGRRGEWTACLPNKVSVSIEGSAGESETVDAAAW
jgi:hypothetical protein